MDTTQLNIAKQIEDSFKIEKELKSKMKSEIDAEEEVIQSSKAIADQLMHTPKVKAIVDGRQFLITMKVYPMLVKKINVNTKETIEVPEDHVVLFAADINKYNLSGGKYTPFKATGKVDKNYSLRDNVKTVVEGFIRHVTGIIRPEVLE